MLSLTRSIIVKILSIIFILMGLLLLQNGAQAAVPSFQAKGTFASGTGALTVSVPAGYADNDVFLLFIESANEAITTPTGWTQVANSPQSTGTAASSGGVRIAAFYKVVSGAQASVSVADTGNHTTAIISNFRGVDTTSPIHITSGRVDASATSAISTPSVTTTVTDTMIVNVIGLDKDFNDTDTITTPPVNANLSGLTEQHDQTVSSGVGGGIAFFTGGKGAAGTVGATTATADTSTTHAYITIALKPANTVPTLSISQPDGVSDTVTVGSSYNITYSLADPEQVVTSAFYYDTDAIGLNGTAITGACANATEGTNSTCLWDTTGVTPGSYYVYGLASDGIAPQVSVYSAGAITINPAPVVPTVTSPTATGISATGATLGANVTSLGIPASISARGVCLGTSPSPTTNCLAEGGTTTGVFTHLRTGLSQNTFYYYRGYATNSTGTGYSSDGTFTTSSVTGTISASTSTCTISSSGSTCNIPFTWSITNATSPNLYNSTTANTYSSSTSGTDVSFPITNGLNTIQVRDGGTALNSTTVTGNCTPGTTWNGSICAVVLTYFDITASSGANGNVTPSGVTSVLQGSSQSYSITPNGGYGVETLVIDGASVATSTSYIFTNVQGAHTISATFSLLPSPPVNFSIVASSGSNGSVSPAGTTTVAQGGSQAYTITPDSGFTIETLVVDSVSIATSTSYTFNNVTASHTISATFALIPAPPGSYTIIANQNPNGTVSPNGSTFVTTGSSQVYSITPNTGYTVGTLIIDSFSVATSTTYTFTNVTANHTIEATFIAIPTTDTLVAVARRLASIIFSGKAFPGGRISIVRKEIGTEATTDIGDTTDANGFFNIRFTDLPTGTHNFGLLIKDPDGRTSQTKYFLYDTNRGDEIFKSIVTPPTIDILNGQVSRGGSVKVFGYASPGHTIRVYLNDILSKEVLAGRGGVYLVNLPTGALDFGQYNVRAKQINLDGGIESDFSLSRTFIVSKLSIVKADLSGDGKIDIKDWSIFLARFSSKNNEVRASIDLSGDGKADISDFSIFIKTLRKK